MIYDKTSWFKCQEWCCLVLHDVRCEPGTVSGKNLTHFAWSHIIWQTTLTKKPGKLPVRCGSWFLVRTPWTFHRKMLKSRKNIIFFWLIWILHTSRNAFATKKLWTMSHVITLKCLFKSYIVRLKWSFYISI